MSQWTIKIESTADGRYQWRHVPAEGTGPGTPHAGTEHYDTPEAARAAGEQALARHHEQAAAGQGGTGDAPPTTPLHDVDTRLGESQATLEAQEDPRLHGQVGSGLAMSQLPVEAQVRTADEQVDQPSRN